MKSRSFCLIVFAACAHALVARSLVNHCDDISFILTSLNSTSANHSELALPTLATHSELALPTGAECIIEIMPTMRPILQPTCTYYKEYSVTVSYTDCKGCKLNTMEIGPGPEVLCAVTTMAPQTVITITGCSPPATLAQWHPW